VAIITFGGDLGSGKTTIAKRLAEALGYEELYVGGIFRTIAAERGLSIEEFYIQLKKDPALERSIDERQAKLMQERDGLVVQGRIAWFFAKQSSFQVINFFIAVDPRTGAQRQHERPENAGRSPDEMRLLSKERMSVERERYKLLYNIDDHLDRSHYDFIINTSKMTADEVFDCVLALTLLRIRRSRE
jgi:cytidylate kinase